MAAPVGARPSLMALLLSPVAGLGHLWIGRARRGYFLFLTATFFWNLALLSAVVPSPPLGDWSVKVGMVGGAGITLYGLFDIFRLAVWARRRKVQIRRREILAVAEAEETAGRAAKARELRDQLLDLDPGDPEVRLALARAARRAGQFGPAVRHAKKALRALPSNPFRRDLEEEIMRAEDRSLGN